MRCRITASLLPVTFSFVLLAASAGSAVAVWPVPPASPPPVPLDDETLGRLVIFAFAPDAEPVIVAVVDLDRGLATLPGGTLALTLGVYECCYFFQPVPARAVWSVSPTDGASIDPATGLLTIGASVPSGSRFLVQVDVERGRRIVEAEVVVFTPEANPLVGVWREEARIDCESGVAVAPASPIGEMVFDADGAFAVTWFPFEVYRDYWGSYDFDLASGRLDLMIAGGNYIPLGFDGSGRFMVDEMGRLVLIELWLGAPPGDAGSGACGHRFIH